MTVRVFGAVPFGLSAQEVTLELDTTVGKPGLHFTGLPARVVHEAGHRITSALVNCGVRIKSLKTVINLAPAELPKNSAGLDLPLAVAVLKAYQIDQTSTDDTLFFSELGLDGALKPVAGGVSLLLAASRLGKKRVITAQYYSSFQEQLPDLEIVGLTHFSEYLEFCKTKLWPHTSAPPTITTATVPPESWSSLRGQPQAQRAAVIAAAGKHHLLLVGPPGVGKSMLAQSLVEILPPLNSRQQLELAAIESLINPDPQLNSRPPLRTPHHTTSARAMLGGHQPFKPGEMSLAHHGVLFLDELSEFSLETLESLRQPIESHWLSIAGTTQALRLPCDFQLVAATNPCPCGHYGTSSRCHCKPGMLSKYQRRLLSPLTDRIELQLNLCHVSHQDIQNPSTGISLASAREMVAVVRNKHRVLASELITQLPARLQTLLETASQKYGLSVRSTFKILEVAQTICLLTQSSAADLTENHILESLQYRLNLQPPHHEA